MNNEFDIVGLSEVINIGTRCLTYIDHNNDYTTGSRVHTSNMHLIMQILVKNSTSQMLSFRSALIQLPTRYSRRVKRMLSYWDNGINLHGQYIAQRFVHTDEQIILPRSTSFV